MKTERFVKCLVALMLMCMGTLPLMAQKNIDKVVKELESRTDVAVNSVTKRDPKTRKIVSMTKTYSVKDERMAGVLCKAFEKDEEYAITANKNMPKGRVNASNMNMYFVFYPQDNEKHSYSLNCSGNGQVTLTIIIKQVKEGNDFSDLDFDFYFDDSEVKTKVASVNKKVKATRARVRQNGNLVVHGDVRMNGKRLGKGVHSINGHRVIVR